MAHAVILKNDVVQCLNLNIFYKQHIVKCCIPVIPQQFPRYNNFDVLRIDKSYFLFVYSYGSCCGTMMK